MENRYRITDKGLLLMLEYEIAHGMTEEALDTLYKLYPELQSGEEVADGGEHLLRREAAEEPTKNKASKKVKRVTASIRAFLKRLRPLFIILLGSFCGFLLRGLLELLQ